MEVGQTPGSPLPMSLGEKIFSSTMDVTNFTLNENTSKSKAGYDLLLKVLQLAVTGLPQDHDLVISYSEATKLSSDIHMANRPFVIPLHSESPTSSDGSRQPQYNPAASIDRGGTSYSEARIGDDAEVDRTGHESHVAKNPEDVDLEKRRINDGDTIQRA